MMLGGCCDIVTLTQCDGTHLGFYLVITMYAGGAGQGLSGALEREITVPSVRLAPSLQLHGDGDALCLV